MGFQPPHRHHSSSVGNTFLRHRKLWLAAIVGLAIGLNVWYVWERTSFTSRATGLLRRSKARAKLEPQDGSQTAAFMSQSTKAEKEAAAMQCRPEQDADYDGEEVLRWGSEFLTSSQEQCCEACRTTAGCNVWVYCGRAEGTCPDNRKPQECWLKKKAELNVIKPQGRRVPDSGWVSGAIYTEEEYQKAVVEIEARKTAEEKRLEALRSNESLPLVFFDVTIKGQLVGRIEMVLFTDISPRSAENFRQMCTGEHGVVPEGKENAGTPYHFKGAKFYRIIHNFIDQAGVYVDSVYGGPYKDDPGGLQLKHVYKGLLSQANMGPDTNTCHFSIMMGPAPHLDGHYTIFGQVVTGFEVVDAINALSIGKPENTAGADEEVVIADAGQLRKGTLEPDLGLGARR